MLAGPERFPAGFADSVHGTCFSSAPLRDLKLVRVFNQKGWPQCKGMLFEYRNGGQRVLGGCRVGVDLRWKIMDPRFMCVRLGYV